MGDWKKTDGRMAKDREEKMSGEERMDRSELGRKEEHVAGYRI